MSEASTQPTVVIHEAVLETISSAGQAVADRTGILVGRKGGEADPEVEALDAAPLSEIASGDTWTSEAVARAREFAAKWHPGKHIVGWYQIAQGGTAWHGTLGRTADLLGPDVPLALLVDPGPRRYLVYVPGRSDGRRNIRPVSHALVSAGGTRHHVAAPEEAVSARKRVRRARGSEEERIAGERREMELAVQALYSEVGWRPRQQRRLWPAVCLLALAVVWLALALWNGLRPPGRRPPEMHGLSTTTRDPYGSLSVRGQGRPPTRPQPSAYPQPTPSRPTSNGPAGVPPPAPRTGRPAQASTPQAQAPATPSPAATGAVAATPPAAGAPTTITVEIDPNVIKQLTDIIDAE